MSNRHHITQRKKGRRTSSLESIDEIHEDYYESNPPSQSPRDATSGDDLRTHLSHRRRRASSILNFSSIDGRIAESSTTDESGRVRNNTGDNTADYEESGESGRPNVSAAALSNTTYSPSTSHLPTSPSHLPKGQRIDYKATTKYDPIRKQWRDGLYSTLKRTNGTEHRMFFFDMEKYPADEMYDRIDAVKEELDKMTAQFEHVVEFLGEHTGWTYRSAVERNIRDSIGKIEGTCEWMRETLEHLWSDRTPALHTSKLE